MKCLGVDFLMGGVVEFKMMRKISHIALTLLTLASVVIVLTQVSSRTEELPADDYYGSNVAPVFEHGDGWCPGGNSTSWAVYLIEDRVLPIIAKELREHGIELSEWNVEWDVIVPRRYILGTVDGKPLVVENYKKGRQLVVDACDSKRRIAIEFVSVADHGELGGAESPYSTGWPPDVKDTAKFLAHRLWGEGMKGVYFGVFYDPVSRSDQYETESNAENSSNLLGKRSVENLLRQVKDFVDWLKAEGAI